MVNKAQHRLEQWHEMNTRHEKERRQLIEYCKAHKMTQREAADVLGVSLSGLNKWLKNHKVQWWNGPRRKRRTPIRLAPDAE